MPIDNTKFTEKYNYYNFYKTPDGEDCVEKIYHYTKYSAVGGLVFSFYEATLFSKPNTVYGTLARFGRFTLPFAGMGFVFGTSLCLLGQIRKKSDVPNHVMASVAAGTVWGMKYRSIRIGHTWAVILAVIAGFHKAYRNNMENTMQIRGPESDYQNPLYDFSIKMYDDPGRPDTF